MTKLKRPVARDTARQCLELGLKVGDTIIGRETYESGGGWSESKLTLLWLGKKEAMWSERSRTDRRPRWGSAVETSAWTLQWRDWYKMTPNA